jgi:hypothetical protein
MTMITYGPIKRWTSIITMAMTVSESRKETEIVFICHGGDNIMI